MKRLLIVLIFFFSYTTYSQTAEEYFDIAYDKAENGDHYGAIEDYTKAIKLDPDDAGAYYNRGWSKNELEDYEGAIADYNKCIELDPDYANAYYNRGWSKSALEDYEGAIEDYTKAIKLDPDDAGAYYNRGNAKSALEDYEGAIADYNKAIELKPDTLFPINYHIEVFVDELSGVEISNDYFFSRLSIWYYSDYDSIYEDLSGTKYYLHPENFINLPYKTGSETYFSDITYEGQLKAESSKFYYVQNVENNFSHNWDLRDFPFDEQILKIHFVGTRDISYMALLPSSSDTLLAAAKINSSNLGLKDGYTATSITSSLSYKKTAYYEEGRKEVVPILTYNITLDRSGSWLFLKLFLGSFLSFFVSAIVFLIPKTDFDSRIELSVGALFVGIGNRYFVDASMPNIMVLTKADLINNLIIIMIIANILLLIVQRNKKVEWNWYEKDYNPIYLTSAILILLSLVIIYLW